MKVKAPRGTRDLLPDDLVKYRFVEKILRDTFEIFGYREVQPPIFEFFNLFALRSGDEIRNTMFTFETGEGEMALRPEMTASICRMIVEGKISLSLKPIRLYYIGRCFRYEEPQAGRYREFWQAGIELIGAKEVEADAEVMILADECLRRIGIKNYELIVGDVGILRRYLEAYEVGYEVQNKILSDIDHAQSTINKFNALLLKEEFNKNDLLFLKRAIYNIESEKRILRMKENIENEMLSALKPDTRVYRIEKLDNEEIKDLIKYEIDSLKKLLVARWCYRGVKISDGVYKMPYDIGKTLLRVLENLEGEPQEVIERARELFKVETVLEEINRIEELVDLLRSSGVVMRLNLGMARGLEYYTGIIFEFHIRELGAQSQVCGGGRYDNLVKEFGGPDIPAAGFAFGLDRLVIAMDLQGVKIPEESKPSVLVVPVNDSLKRQAFMISLMLRRKGIKSESSLIKEKLRKALSRANKMGIRYVVIVGPKELNENKVILRDMVRREQKIVPIDSLDEVIV